MTTPITAGTITLADKISILYSYITPELTGRRGSFSPIPWSDSLNVSYLSISVAMGLRIKQVKHKIPITSILTAIVFT